MTFTWDNPLGYDIIATRRCNGCGNEDVRSFWSRPLRFAAIEEPILVETAPLTMPDVAGMLRDAPFCCLSCDGGRASLVGIAVDEASIPF
ncbi:hypothetical protein J2W76_003914 [Methylorubrum zatmanii]|nr:hypothetical protein [Methylorubrum zatmanii]MCP1552718.1 hypothetical protein [Methylorubrum extorquens]MCP1580972.1 hypothetical protein [Methylorubrum extorquens]